MLGLCSNGFVPGVVPHIQLRTWCAHPLLLSLSLFSSLLLARTKINFTSEGCSLKCLLKVFLSPAASFCYLLLILMCKHVCSLNPPCITFVVNVVLPRCLTAETIFTNAVRQLEISVQFLRQRTEHCCFGVNKRTCKISMFCVPAQGLIITFMPVLDVQ